MAGLLALTALLTLPALTACSGAQSALDPAGPAAREIAVLWWAMLAYGTLAWAVVLGLWWWASRRRRGADTASSDPSGRSGQRWIIVGGVLWPLVSISALLAAGIPAGDRILTLSVPRHAPLTTVDVVGRQWRWEVTHPSGRTLVNELRLPAGQPVELRVRTQDVIHSVWVPRLGGKIDAIPGRVNRLRLQADAPGTHRGQCAEFCGLRHADMVLTVVVMPAHEFAAWVEAGHD